ncbi:hypothetical protein Tco_1034227 [Tanacetum coccineum]
MTLRSCLRRKPTGKIFRTVDLRWVPTGKIFTPSTTKVDSEPPNGSNADIANQYECAQTLDVSAGTLNLSADNMANEHVPSPATTRSDDQILLFNALGVDWKGALTASADAPSSFTTTTKTTSTLPPPPPPL